jgi:hypothetical protein
MGDESDFEFDDIDINDDDLNEMDNMHLQLIKNQTLENSSQETDEAFSFWLLVLLLVFFVFFISIAIYGVVKNRETRRQYEEIGYYY